MFFVVTMAMLFHNALEKLQSSHHICGIEKETE